LLYRYSHVRKLIGISSQSNPNGPMPSTIGARVIQKVLIAILLLSAGLVVVTTLVWTFQERIAFQPPAAGWPSVPAELRVDYRADDGQALFGYIVGDRNAPNGLLLSFHGNADLAGWQIDWAEELNRRTGVTVLLAEYRGYMGLEGQPSYGASRSDADAAYRFAVDSLRIPPNSIAFFGHSMGSAIAADLAARSSPAALILQAPFTSARDMAARMTGYRPPNWLWRLISRLHYDTGALVATIKAPVSVSHGGKDRLIPPTMGETVFTVAKQKGQWLLVPGAAHNDVEAVGGEAYWSWMKRSLEPVTE
jgi:acetyl esterase/lipase